MYIANKNTIDIRNENISKPSSNNETTNERRAKQPITDIKPAPIRIVLLNFILYSDLNLSSLTQSDRPLKLRFKPILAPLPIPVPISHAKVNTAVFIIVVRPT